jgi:hypothetical protein
MLHWCGPRPGPVPFRTRESESCLPLSVSLDGCATEERSDRSLSPLRVCHSGPSARTATIAPLPKCREAPACFDVPLGFEKVVLGLSLTNAKNGRDLTYDAVINIDFTN